ncbi:hypothetical protein Tco_0315815 [Tanacetum coccineum]
MLIICKAFLLTAEIRETRTFKEYKTVFMKSIVCDDDETEKEKEVEQDMKGKETEEIKKEQNIVEKEVKKNKFEARGSIVGMGRRRNQIRSHIKNKLHTALAEFFARKRLQEVSKTRIADDSVDREFSPSVDISVWYPNRNLMP